MKGLGILCPGQGNQHHGMFEILADNPAAHGTLRSAADLCGCHPVAYLNGLAAEDLFSNQAAQHLVGILQIATWDALRDMLPRPKVFAGYSLGELAAYGCAGALGTAEILALIGKRAALMDAVAPHPSGLLAIRGLNREEVDKLCHDAGAEVAIINSFDHFVLGGPEEALQNCEKHPLANRATTIKRLQVTIPSHTPWLSSASNRFAHELNCSSLGAPHIPVLAGTSGSVVRTREEAIVALSEQISSPINWLACMQTVIEMGCNVILELGPGNALAKMLQELFPAINVRSVADFRSLPGIAAWTEKHLQ